MATTQIQTVAKGQSDWQEPVNELINWFNAGGDIKWTQSSDGIVFQNGFQNIDSTYFYAKVGNATVVDLRFSVTLPSAPSNNPSTLTAASLPENLQGGHFEHVTGLSKYFVTLQGTQVLLTRNSDTESWWSGSDSHYIAHFVYVVMQNN